MTGERASRVARVPRVSRAKIVNTEDGSSTVVTAKSSFNFNTLLLIFAILLLIGIAFFVGALWQKVTNLQTAKNTAPVTVQQPVAQKPQVTLDQVKNVFAQNVIKFGDASRKVLVLEFADPSCPYCQAAAGLNPELNNQMGPNFKLSTQGGSYVAPVLEFRKLVDSGQASYAYVYFPGHANGEMGMKALYCAADQDKFWQAHDKLMTNAGYKLLNDQVKNDTTKSGQIASFFNGIVNTIDLKTCIESGKYDKHLQDDIAIANPFRESLGPNFGTPTFYVNTTSFPGAVNYSTIKSTVENYLK